MENKFFEEVASVKIECEKSSDEEIRQTYEHVLKKINAQESRKQPKRKILFRYRYAVCAAAAAIGIILPAVYSLTGRLNIDKAAFGGAGKGAETEKDAFGSAGKNTETEKDAFGETGKAAQELESDLLEANDYAMALLRGNKTSHASGRAGD